MELKVIKPFHGKVENKVMNKGDLVHSTDVERINALVSGGFCAIVSLSDAPNENDNNANDDNAPKDDANITKDSVVFNGTAYQLETLKEGLALIGVSLASNVKERGVSNALGKLTEEQAQKLAEYLNENDNNANDDNAPKDDANITKDSVVFNGTAYQLETLKEGLALIGVSLASNVKERGVSNALGKLTEEQAQKLAEYLNENDNNVTE